MKKLLITLLSTTYLLVGCSSQFVGNTTLKNADLSIIGNQIIPNVTTKQEIRDMFGEPTETKARSYDLSEIWTYKAYDEHKNYAPTVLLPITLPLSIVFGVNLMSPRTTHENEKHLRLQFENNKVRKFWLKGHF